MRWYQSVLIVIAGSLLVGSAVAQQGELALRSEPLAPTPAFDGDLPKLAAVTPLQPVSLKVDFAPTTSIEALAELSFAERIKVFSIYVIKHASKNRRSAHGYSFSILGPAREDQVARARCQEQVPFEMNDPGPDRPLEPGAPRVSMIASVVLPAEQANRWMQTHPSGVIGVELPRLVGQDSLLKSEEVMRNVLTLQLPAFGATQLPPGCEKYLSIRR